MDSDLERVVGRLEGKIEQGFEDLRERMDRMREGVFGKEGIDSRLRSVEGEVREIKAKAGLIAFIVSLVVAAGIWITRFFNGR